MSSVGYFSNLKAYSNPINFKGTDNCIDLKSGIYLIVGEKNQGLFTIDCELPIKIENLNLQVYPNPSEFETFLKIDNNIPFNEMVSLQIINSLGLLVEEKLENSNDLHHGIKLDVSHLIPGIYFIRIKSAYYQQTQKFIKMN